MSLDFYKLLNFLNFIQKSSKQLLSSSFLSCFNFSFNKFLQVADFVSYKKKWFVEMIMIKNDSHKTEIKKKCLKKGQKKVCFYDHNMFKSSVWNKHHGKLCASQERRNFFFQSHFYWRNWQLLVSEIQKCWHFFIRIFYQ